MEITVWNDYVCPWAYAARPLTDWLREYAAERGVVVTTRSYELHPDLPPEGRSVRPGGRLDGVFAHIAQECKANGQPFVRPARSPNTHRLLTLAELVRVHAPESFDAVDRALAELHWVTGADLQDDAVVRQALIDNGVETAPLFERLADGEGDRLLEESMIAAREVEVSATPAWRIGEMTIVGLHPPEQFQRWASRLIERDAQSEQVSASETE